MADDLELVELFAGDPEALAVADAIIATQDDTRARRRPQSRRRLLAPRGLTRPVVVAGIAAIAIAAPAFAIVRGMVDFDHSQLAHGLIVRDFKELSLIDRLNGFGALTGPARRIEAYRASDGSHDLYAAPSRGGFCWGVSDLGVTCETPSSGRIEPLYSGIPKGALREAPLIAGAVDVRASRLDVRFRDGTSTGVPLIAVSRPIDAAFFVYEVPPSHWAFKAQPVEVVALDRRGNIVSRGRLMYESAVR